MIFYSLKAETRLYISYFALSKSKSNQLATGFSAARAAKLVIQFLSSLESIKALIKASNEKSPLIPFIL